MHGLNSSGPSPQSISIDAVKERGHAEIPEFGWIPITVPGAVGAWAELSKKFGKLPFTEVLKPAIIYAEKGYPVSPVLGKNWQAEFEKYRQNARGKLYQSWFDTFAPKNRPPKIGEIFASKDHANTL